MVQLIPGITPAASPATRNADPLNDLTILLNRLQRTILHADAEREARLRENEFEREKAQQNISYARSLLTKIEHEALSVKIHTRRQSLQTDLVRKRELLDQLSERLDDLAEFAAANSTDNVDESSDGDTSDGEDILADIIATPSESLESHQSRDEPEEDAAPGIETPPSPVAPPPPPIAQPKQDLPVSTATPAHPAAPSTTETSQTLRPRRTAAPAPASSADGNEKAESTSRSALFGNHPSNSSSSAAAPIVKTTEAILDHQRAEQDALSESILKLASDLKASSQAFSSALEEDKEVVDRAAQGMTKTGEGMDAVTTRMGLLQRMTEGEGWWGRMRLYAIVYGLMVVLVLLVGVAPKLRF